MAFYSIKRIVQQSSAQMNSPVADVIKYQNRHQLEIKNNVACD